jgi:flagellar hook-length control protein FliK
MSGAFLGIEPATSKTSTPYVSPVKPAGEKGFDDLMRGLLKHQDSKPRTENKPIERPKSEKPKEDIAAPAKHPQSKPAIRKSKKAAQQQDEQPSSTEDENTARGNREVAEKSEKTQKTEPVETKDAASQDPNAEGVEVKETESQIPVETQVSEDDVTSFVLPEAAEETPEMDDVAEAVSFVNEEMPVEAEVEPKVALRVKVEEAEEEKPQASVEAEADAPVVLTEEESDEMPEAPQPFSKPTTVAREVSTPAPQSSAEKPVAPAPEPQDGMPAAAEPPEAAVEEEAPVLTMDSTEVQDSADPMPVETQEPEEAKAPAGNSQPAASQPQKPVPSSPMDKAISQQASAPETPVLNIPAGATLLHTNAPEPADTAKKTEAASKSSLAAQGNFSEGMKAQAAVSEEVPVTGAVAQENGETSKFIGQDASNQQPPASSEEGQAALNTPRSTATQVVGDGVSFRSVQSAAQQAQVQTPAGQPGTLNQNLVKVERLHELMNRFDEHVMSLASGKDKTMSITLVPETLGKVVLNCREHSGHMTVQIVAESQVVKDLLQQQEPSVRSLLEQNGYKMDSFDVRTQDGQGDRRPFDRQQAQAEGSLSSLGGTMRTDSAAGHEPAKPSAWKPAGAGGIWVVA